MITPTQRDLRRKHVGASDVPAILGFDPYRSQEDVWAEKYLTLEGDLNSDAIETGNDLEPVILNWAGRNLANCTLGLEPLEFIHPGGIMLAHPDAVAQWGGGGRATPVEAKYRSSSKDWGDTGTSDIPEDVAVQLASQFSCMASAFGHVAAWLLDGRQIAKRLYRVERDDRLVDRIVELVHDWWERHVVRGERPVSDRGPSLDVMKRLRQLPDTVTEIDAALVDDFVAAREARNLADKACEAAEARLRMAMQSSAVRAGGTLVVRKKTEMKGHVVAPHVRDQLWIKKVKE